MALAYSTNGFGTLIQSVSRFGVTIVWFTTTPDTSQVKLGTTSGVLNLVYNNTTAGVPDGNGNFKHTMTIRGLTPNTKYFYSVGSTTGTVWFGGTADEFFWTSPDTSVAQPTRIWCLADYGDGSSRQSSAKNGFVTFNSNAKVDLWLGSGDLAYSSGNWSEVVSRDFGVYPTQYKQYPHFTTPGNHDWYGDLAYFDIYVTPAQNQLGGVASNSNKFYSFNYGNIHVISYDSHSLNLSTTGAFYKWLRNDLINWETERNAGRLKWCIVITHYPAYSKGTHDSDGTGDEMGNNRTIINPLLETYNVDLVVYGHSHNYERSNFMRNFYGNSSTFNNSLYPAGNVVQAGTGNPTPYDKTSGQIGTIYITNGWGGASSGTSSGWPNNANLVSLTTAGSTVIDFNTPVGGVQSMRVRAVQGPGGTIVDDFTVIK